MKEQIPRENANVRSCISVSGKELIFWDNYVKIKLRKMASGRGLGTWIEVYLMSCNGDVIACEMVLYILL